MRANVGSVVRLRRNRGPASGQELAMTSAENLKEAGVALLASRISVLGEDSCGGSEIVLWEDVSILRSAGFPVRVYARAARSRGSVNVISLRTGSPLITSLEYGGRFLQKERKALLVAYNEPSVAGWAPDRTIVRFDWTTPLPRYLNWAMWLSGWVMANGINALQQRQLIIESLPRTA